MTPKEKAKALVEKFREFAHSVYSDNILEMGKTETASAKKCALIAVEEILEWEDWQEKEMYKFWQEVKQEIEKL